jgi:ribosomal protein S18 acetylase RimI-like enzyme
MVKSTSLYTVRKGKSNDLSAIKAIADTNRDELGFLLRSKVKEALEDHRVFVATTKADEIVGFVIYRHRQIDAQTTLYDICVVQSWRGQGVGRSLIEALQLECIQLKRQSIQLKCPENLPANLFYERFGFSRTRVEAGRVRKLNVWQLPINVCEVM